MSGEITLGVSGDTGLLMSRIAREERPGRLLEEASADGISYITLPVPEEAAPQTVRTLAEYIIDRYEPSLLNRVLSEKHDYLTNTQRREILRHLDRFASDRDFGYPMRRRLVENSLRRYFEESDTIRLDGFVAFRLGEYERLLSLLSDRLVDAYLVQKEYDEFLELLKFFVQSQEDRPSLIHIVVLDDGTYQVIDTFDHDITRDCISEIQEDAGEFHELTVDDILISVLISVAPKTIVVHNREFIRNVELFNTISKVFDGNITYCCGCSMCMKKPILV